MSCSIEDELFCWEGGGSSTVLMLIDTEVKALRMAWNTCCTRLVLVSGNWELFSLLPAHYTSGNWHFGNSRTKVAWFSLVAFGLMGCVKVFSAESTRLGKPFNINCVYVFIFMIQVLIVMSQCKYILVITQIHYTNKHL